MYNVSVTRGENSVIISQSRDYEEDQVIILSPEQAEIVSRWIIEASKLIIAGIK